MQAKIILYINLSCQKKIKKSISYYPNLTRPDFMYSVLPIYIHLNAAKLKYVYLSCR